MPAEHQVVEGPQGSLITAAQRESETEKMARITKKKLAATIAVFALVLTALLWGYLSNLVRPIWSIGIYTGPSPLQLTPGTDIHNPVLTASNVSDVPARFVADPFMVREKDTWYMFFEVLNTWTGQGDIGLAISKDARKWQYSQIVLDEPFHLSYPYVFENNGTYYMIPECGMTRSIRLYKATEFPLKWALVKTLLYGDYVDPSVIYSDGRWWLFALRDSFTLSLHYAQNLTGPWIEHPQSPLVKGDMNMCRPGGRLILFDNKVIRYAQDCEPTYGNALRAFQVDELTPLSYREHECRQVPVLAGDGDGWNASGMHQVDPHPLNNSGWIACVDGHESRSFFEWRRPLGGLHKLGEILFYSLFPSQPS